MEKALNHVKKEGIIAPATLVGLAALTGYTIKTNLELNKKIDFLENEIRNMKSTLNENNKRSNIAFTRLNQKIEETNNSFKNVMQLRPMPVNKPTQKIEEVPDENKDDVSSALDALMKH